MMYHEKTQAGSCAAGVAFAGGAGGGGAAAAAGQVAAEQRTAAPPGRQRCAGRCAVLRRRGAYPESVDYLSRTTACISIINATSSVIRPFASNVMPDAGAGKVSESGGCGLGVVSALKICARAAALALYLVCWAPCWCWPVGGRLYGALSDKPRRQRCPPRQPYVAARLRAADAAGAVRVEGRPEGDALVLDDGGGYENAPRLPL